MSVEEAASVLAHEIGHYRRHHVQRMLAVSLGGMLAILAVLSRLLPWPPLYAAFGFGAPSLHAGVALLAVGGGAFVFWLAPLASFFSRRHEYEADRYSVRLARAPEALKGALLRLSTATAWETSTPTPGTAPGTTAIPCWSSGSRPSTALRQSDATRRRLLIPHWRQAVTA